MTAAAYLNPSFEIAGGTVATLLSGGAAPFLLLDGATLEVETPAGGEELVFEVGSKSTIVAANVGPYALTAGWTLTVAVDGGPAQLVTFNEATPSVLTSGNSQPFALADGQFLGVEINGVPTYVVFNAEDFADITAATAAEVVAVLDAALSGVTVAATPTEVELTTVFKGATALVRVIDGNAAAALGFPAGVAGTGYIQTISAAMAAEVAADILAAVGGGEAWPVDGAVAIASQTKGSASLINVTGGTAAATFAFPAGASGVQFFVDIAAASVAEVVARINAQAESFEATASGAQVELALLASGADQCFSVIGGAANLALAFPETLACGETAPGTAQGWTLSSTSSVWEFAEFAVGVSFLAVEDFTIGWLSAEDDLTELGIVNPALFGGIYLAEVFDLWLPLVSELPAAVAAGFNTAYPPGTAFEAFAQGWPATPGNEGDTQALGTTTTAQFDGEAVEDFNEQWSGNEGDTTFLGALTNLVFGQGTTSDGFTPYSAVHSEILVAAVTTGHTYAIVVNGFPAAYVALGGDGPSDVAAELTARVNDLPLEVTAVQSGARVRVTDLTSTGIVVGTGGTQPSQIYKAFDGAVRPDVQWGGADRNPVL